MREGLLVCGNLNIDHILSVLYLPGEGESAPVSGRRVEHGGCGGNIAYSASLLSVPVSLSCAIGEDFDIDYMGRLRELPIDLSGVHVIEGELSPLCTIFTDPEGRQCYAFMMGAMDRQNELPVPETHEYCHIATSDPRFSIKVAGKQGGEGANVALDPGQEIFFRWEREDLTEALGYSSRFFGNLGEWIKLSELMGWSGIVESMGRGDVPTYPEAFDLIDEAVITDGERGAYLITSGGIFRSPACDVDVVDPTGAGDAFRGGFYAALHHGRSSRDALAFGNRVASLSVATQGAQNHLMDWDGLENMVRSDN